MGKQKMRTRCYLDISIGGDPIGRIVLELFNELCPKATENFKKLCQGGCGLGLKTAKPLHYQGSIFHRVIKGFMIQGGDFSNRDGTGGESIYGGTFAGMFAIFNVRNVSDECLSTPHDRPFLLSMANRGPNTNGSQFFITTAPAPHLDGKHVVFGHVLSGEDVVRKAEAVPITDTKTHRPVKPVVIDACGELIPVKKKKLKAIEDTKEKKHKKKSKKEKRKKRKVVSDEESESTANEVECSVRPEEIPEVPAPKFLYRGRLESDQKHELDPKEESGSRPDYLPPESVLQLLDNDGPLMKQIAAAVGRELIRVTRERQNDRSGRKVKGRGRMCYRSPDSRSGSRDRSITPPHWRQASQNTQRLDQDGWQKWREQRARHRINQARDVSRPSPSPRDTQSRENSRRKTSVSPSLAAASARNRSPSGTRSSSTASDTSGNDAVGRTILLNMTPATTKKTSPSMDKKRSDGRLPSPSTKRDRSSDDGGNRSPGLHARNTYDGLRDLKNQRTSPVLPKRVPLTPDDRRGVASNCGRSVIVTEDSGSKISKQRPIVDIDYDDDEDEEECSRETQRMPMQSKRTEYEINVPEKIPKINGSLGKRRSRSPVRTPPRRSPPKYAASPNLRSPPQKRIRSPNASLPARRSSQRYASNSPASFSSELRYASQDVRNARITRPELTSPPTHRPLVSPVQRVAVSPVPTVSRSQISPLMRSPQRGHLSRSPIQSAVPSRTNRSSDTIQHEKRVTPTTQSPIASAERVLPKFQPSPILPAVASSSAKHVDTNQPLTGKIPSTHRGSRSSSRSRSGSSSSEKSDRSRSARSRSRSIDRAPKRGAPRSPPPHLLQKWRMRHEQLIQKRRMGPSVSSAFYAPPLTSDDRARRTLLPGHNRVSRSKSRSQSFSPPRRRRVRSSTSHSRSGSSDHQPRSRHFVSLGHRRSPTGTSSRSHSSEHTKSKTSERSKSRSPVSRHRVRNQATSPVKLSKEESSKKNVIVPPTAASNPVVEESIKTSKWEDHSPKLTEKLEKEPQRSSWTTSHWQTTSERAKIPTNASNITGPDGPTTKAPKLDGQAPGSVLQRLRMAQLAEHPESTDQSATSENAAKRVDIDEAKVQEPSCTEVVVAASSVTTTQEAVVVSTKPHTTTEKSPDQPKKSTVIRCRSSSASSSTSADTSASSSSSGSSASHSCCSRSRSLRRRSISPFARSLRRRSDFSDSRSRGRGSYYGRYSPINPRYGVLTLAITPGVVPGRDLVRVPTAVTRDHPAPDGLETVHVDDMVPRADVENDPTDTLVFDALPLVEVDRPLEATVLLLDVANYF
ncbi:hypothetical protein P879_02117 [Paragonimus westermani]|uniref:peptidylprolyl isomerase n=1 Tax=Paragonimus westermani TaxID=34504 RepID=A0A8T0DGI6_9TREM|nr:hypothetical protein P879_02117 [Paragonimus westermani]